MTPEQMDRSASLTTVTMQTDPAHLERTARGSLVGPIWLNAGQLSFPESRWTDFAVVVVREWLEAIRGIGSRGKWQAHCRFMDGPYSFTIDGRSPAVWHMTLLGAADVVMAEYDVHAIEFHSSVVTVAEQLIRVCHERGWRNRDLEQLEAAYSEHHRM